MIKINLLGKKKTPAPFGLDQLFEKAGIRPGDLESMKPAFIKIGAILLIFYAAQEAPHIYFDSKLKQLDATLKGLTDKVESMQKILAEKKEIRKDMEQLLKEEAETKRQLDVISSISKDRSVPFKVVDNLSAILPQKVWISRMEITGQTIQLEGNSWDYFSINEYIRSLNESPLLQAVTLRSMASEELATKPIAGIPEADQKTKVFQLEMMLRQQLSL
jgi:Tfp pilus assembly protein PilN